MKRYFAFGCSYSDYDWLMLPDLIGVNFDKYYNLGSSGADHQFMLMQLIQANELYKFNPDTDYVTIGTTGFGRFTYVEKHPQEDFYDWKKHGDIFPEFNQHPDKARLWAREFDSYRYSVYRSLFALKTIKVLLTSMNIKHTIYRAVHNMHLDPSFHDPASIDNITADMIREFYSLCDTEESIDEYLADYLSTRGKFYHPWLDGHPTIGVTYRFLSKYFSEYDTDLVKKICRDHEHAINTIPTRQEHNNHFKEKFLKVYRTDYDVLHSIKSHPRYITDVTQA